MLCVTNNSVKHQSFIYTQLNVKAVLFQTIQFRLSTQFQRQTVLFQAIQFSISTHFSSFRTIDRTQSNATTPGQSEPESDSNEGVLHIARASPSDCLDSYPGHSLGEFYFSAKMQSVYSTAATNWTKSGWWFWVLLIYQMCKSLKQLSALTPGKKICSEICI